MHVRITYIALNDGFVRFLRYGRRSPCARAVVLLHQRDRFQLRIFISSPLDNLVYNAHVSYTRGVTSKPGIARQRRRLIHFAPIDFDGACELRTRGDGVCYVAYWDVRVHVYVTTHVCARQPHYCVRLFIIKYLERRRRRWTRRNVKRKNVVNKKHLAIYRAEGEFHETTSRTHA